MVPFHRNGWYPFAEMGGILSPKYPKQIIDSNNILKNLKIGSQGTNFKATKEQYEELLKMIPIMKTTYPLNSILFGPPGTGKTYHTKNRAIQIIEELSDDEFNKTYQDRTKLNEVYEKYKNEGRIEFVTFHQSFSYEDFIEGIKPVMENGGEEDPNISDSIQYKIEDGIFKSISERSKSTLTLQKIDEPIFSKEIIDNLDKINFAKISLGRAGTDEADIIYDYCMENNCISMGWGSDVDFTNADENQVEELLKDKGEPSSYAKTAVRCLKFWLQKGDIVFVSNGTKKVKAIGQIDGDYYFLEKAIVSDYHQFRKVKWLMKDLDISPAEVYEKKLSQQTIYMMYNNSINKDFFRNLSGESKNIETKSQHFVLIIDEINRGNIANIFGELITLIENDKREGNDEALETILPYSKTNFSVPSNLYLIGTMNTADRSIEALDTALRRRFRFFEMKPDVEIIKEELGHLKDTIDLAQLLETINNRIQLLMDKDHCIGHSNFLKLKDCTKENIESSLREVFKNEIIPLLQEYFYGDLGKIGMILGEKFYDFDPKGTPKTSLAKFPIDGFGIIENTIYKMKEDKDWKLDTFKSIYE